MPAKRSIKAGDLVPSLGVVAEVANGDAAHERAARPLFARGVARAESLAPAEGQQSKTNAGRWRLNAGNEMTMVIDGLNQKADQYGRLRASPCRIVIDLATAALEKPVIPCLEDHIDWSTYYCVGNWSGASVTDKGIDADLRMYVGRTEAEAELFAEATKLKAMLEQGHPWEASVGAYPEQGLDGYEPVAKGQKVTVNGREFSGDGELPLFVMRGARVAEASIVMWGADSDTGRIAAHRTHLLTARKDAVMYDLAKILAKYQDPAHQALAAGRVAAAQAKAEAERPTAAVLEAEIDGAVKDAQIKAKDDEIAALKAAATKQPEKPAEKPTKAPVKAGEAAKGPGFVAGETEGESDAPASVYDAMRQLQAEGHKATGFKLRAAALVKWPSLRASLPDAQVGKK